jgi:crossover junction endodeoxyribonuclease RusA
MMFDATLPFPPSLNAAVRHIAGGGHYLSPEAKRFRASAIATLKHAAARCHHQTITKACAVVIDLYPPDKRKRDADNRIKAVLDCLQLAGVVKDDNLCRDVRVVSHDEAVEKGGRCNVTVTLL